MAAGMSLEDFFKPVRRSDPRHTRAYDPRDDRFPGRQPTRSPRDDPDEDALRSTGGSKRAWAITTPPEMPELPPFPSDAAMRGRQQQPSAASPSFSPAATLSDRGWSASGAFRAAKENFNNKFGFRWRSKTPKTPDAEFLEEELGFNPAPKHGKVNRRKYRAHDPIARALEDQLRREMITLHEDVCRRSEELLQLGCRVLQRNMEVRRRFPGDDLPNDSPFAMDFDPPEVLCRKPGDYVADFAGRSRFETVEEDSSRQSTPAGGVDGGASPPARHTQGHRGALAVAAPLPGDEDDAGTRRVKRGSCVLASAEEMKENVREAVFGQHEHRHLKSDHPCSSIVRGPCLNKMTLLVIVLNSAWMYFDTDHNSEQVVTDAPLHFVLMEAFFTVYFLMDWGIRVMALKDTDDLWRGWLFFDTVLLAAMLLDGWGLALAQPQLSAHPTLGDPGETSGLAPWFLRIFLCVRALRLARMVKLLHALPQLTVYSEVIGIALRHVFSMLCLLVLALYAFGIVFRSLAEGTRVGETYFRKVPDAMHTLLFHGVFVDGLPVLANELLAESALMYMVLLCFVLLATLTLLNALVALLVHVVGAVSAVERERVNVVHVHATMERLMRLLGHGGLEDADDIIVTKRDFLSLLATPAVEEAFRELGIDVLGLYDLCDFLYAPEADVMTLRRFLDLLLQMRGDNQATVRDMMDIRRYLKHMVNGLERRLNSERQANPQDQHRRRNGWSRGEDF